MDNFWEVKSLQNMTEQEWESICDGCAKCCLHKFIDDQAATKTAATSHFNQGETIHYTNIACGLLNTKTCSCTQYAQRTHLVPECVQLTKENLQDIFFMPNSCSYRRLHENRGLASWHPLLNKGKKSVMHKVGMSVRGKTVADHDVDLEQFEDYIALWPMQDLD